MKKTLRNKIVTVLGMNALAIIAAAQSEVMAQGAGVCSFGNIGSPCNLSGTITYPSFMQLYGASYRIFTNGMITNNGTLSSADPAEGTAVFLFPTAQDQLFGANQFNFTNNGTITGSGEYPVILSNYAGLTANIINAGNIYTRNSSLSPFTPVSAASYTYAVDISRASSLTLENKAGANIIGAAGAVRIGAYGGGALIKVTNAGRMESASTNSAALELMGNYATGVVNSGSFITNEATGVIKGAGNGIFITNYSSGFPNIWQGLTITNRGTIEGVTSAGIHVGSAVGPVTINNYGTISGAVSAIQISNSGRNTFNIYDGAVFTNGVNFNTTTLNTINFYTGSYTLGVKNYLVASNTINLLGTGTQLITSGLNGAGTGDIVVVAPQVATTPTTTTTTVAASVSNVVSAVSNVAASVSTLTTTPSTIAPPVQGITPEVPAPGRDSGGIGSDYTAYDPVSPNPAGTRTGIQTYSMANLSEFSATDLLRGKQGQKVDAKGNLAWGRAFGSYRALPSTARVVGNSTAMGGVIFGFDRNLDHWRLGAYAGYAYGHTRMNDASGNVSTDYYMGGVYARRDFGAYTLLANLSGGVMANRMSRSINLGAQQAKSSFTGFFLAPELALSRDVAVAPGWVLTPTLRVRYVGSFLPSYRESGSSQNIAYGSSTSHGFEERAELKLTRTTKTDAGLVSSFYVQAAAIGNHRVGGDSLNASLLNSAIVIRNPHKRHTAGASIGVGFDHQLTQNTSAFGGIDAAYYTDKTRSVIGRAGVKVTF